MDAPSTSTDAPSTSTGAPSSWPAAWASFGQLQAASLGLTQLDGAAWASGIGFI